jgi:hypothetical protein
MFNWRRRRRGRRGPFHQLARSRINCLRENEEEDGAVSWTFSVRLMVAESIDATTNKAAVALCRSWRRTGGVEEEEREGWRVMSSTFWACHASYGIHTSTISLSLIISYIELQSRAQVVIRPTWRACVASTSNKTNDVTSWSKA